jgi:hypothetical protein
MASSARFQYVEKEKKEKGSSWNASQGWIMMILLMIMQFATDAAAATTELLRMEIRSRKGT